MAYRVGVVGAVGFAGAELVRLLASHPFFELGVITSNADAGEPFSNVYPAYKGVTDLTFAAHDDSGLAECDAVFLAVPHTAAMAMAPGLLAKGVSVFDLSADYRLSSAAAYERWYGVQHSSAWLLETRAFGLPELFPAELDNAAALPPTVKAHRDR
ncbi:hypothetical protein DMP06_01580 [Slackia equolifaciens]|uniref:Semialdehyde dehydrogenase NAD-binding domain-containing protein n=1 Tax=Slackia equolifaciens TaxID=498718 RepID=A0A3N0B4T1_9ACTN|nr:hypothetical protein [Slackia equolifaciens]RNL42122.1 hypothetical protein DMP06_01580 [Slackia equolifaciens]